MSKPTTTTPLGDPHVFASTAVGSGAFGRWILDRAGLPAYQYTADQYRNSHAGYPNSEQIDRRDHWHQIGNDRITALASNDGTIQVYLCDRGGVLLNRFEAHTAQRRDPVIGKRSPGSPDPYSARRIPELRVAQQQELADYLTALHEHEGLPGAAKSRHVFHGPPPHAYAGGFSYLADGEQVWATAYRYRPARAKTERIFGMGYVETTMIHRDIRVTRHVYAPDGDDPVLLIDVEIENQRSVPVDLCHYEYWDVNRYQLKLQWFRTGPLTAQFGDSERHDLNDQFMSSIRYDGQQHALRFHQDPCSPDAPPPDEVSPIDWWPADIFLADLSDVPPAASYTQRSSFFGDGGAKHPSLQPDPAKRPDGAMSCCMVLRHDLHLEAQATIKLRFVYGTIRPELSLQSTEKFRAAPSLSDTLRTWQEKLAYFTTSQEPYLQREMAWHAYNLLSATIYHALYGVHFVPQGSAYLYLHGADGAPRDQALYVVPLAYLRPELARDTLRLIMRLTHSDTGAIPYAFGGYGVHDGATVHTDPSDLDLFFLLAIGEYLAATGDLGFLESDEPFYPPGTRPSSVTGTTVLDHIRVAVNHLKNGVGIGDHHLIKIGDGDWSDSIVLETALKKPFEVSFANSKARGESVPNTQMALYVLPLTAALVQSRDPVLAASLEQLAEELRMHIDQQWSEQGNWYTRAILRGHLDNPVVQGAERINLEAQPWALISRIAAETGRETDLIKSITELLDDPSPIGATLLENGMVWPAVSQLLTWGYTRNRPDLAWRSLKRHTFAAHAKAFPNVWINIWSGPDGINGTEAENPGGSWSSPLTPMTDFPVMNANQDAMALLGLLRVCGIEPSPSGDGLVIAPQAPPDHFVLDLPLLRLEVAPRRIAGEYRAFVEGSRVLHVRFPANATGVSATIDGHPIEILQPNTSEVALNLVFNAGQRVPFEVRWNA